MNGKYIILAQSNRADPDAYGPYDTRSDAEAALTAARYHLWSELGEDGSVEVIALRDLQR